MSMRNFAITLAGILFIIVGGFAFYNAWTYYTPATVFWLCYISMILNGLGILMRNPVLIKSQLYLLAIPDLIWGIDFFTYLLTGASLWGITDYFFLEGELLPKLITLQHLFTIPVLFCILLLMKQKSEGSWKLSIVQLTGFFILGRLLTDPIENVNCVYHGCGILFNTSPEVYPFIWFTLGILMIFLSRAVFIQCYRLFSRKVR
ncbi:hypothetical protein HYZ97_02815 [Candidatus Pacearchaeota archaeon]|nr:hypothetical protein [Candidatus Pacearchaeota archaeon]